jgi:hypothetical protein
MEILIKSTTSMQLHSLTETHPVMSIEQYEAFKADIAKNGQMQPVIAYRDKIVDGRHRLRALTDLGIATIKVTNLPNNLTLDEVKQKVVSTEKRRHQSPTQLAINGYRLYKAGAKQTEAVLSTGCSLANLKHVVALEKLGRLDIIDLLEKGGKVDIGVANYNKFTDSLLGIVTWVKKQQDHTEQLLQDLVNKVDTEVVEPKVEVDMNKIDGITLITSSYSDKELEVLIAKLYKQLRKE